LKAKWKVIFVAVAVLAIAVFNGAVGFPVASALASDSRNKDISLVAYRSLGLHPTDITLNIVQAKDAAPLDVLRALFQSAEALKDRKFGRVNLVRGMTLIYSISGDDFNEIGKEYAAGQNPTYLVRTLPEKLRGPDGRNAFGTWTGGMLGVLTQQLQEANEAARTWIGVS
jgi:hypothetical protein